MSRATPASTTPMTSILAAALRSPKRVTITLPYLTYEQLLNRSDLEGRSLSNLASYLLETALNSNGHQRR